MVVDVTRILHDYADAVDRRDWDALEELLDDEVVLTRGETSVQGSAAFRAAYRPFFESAALASRHVVTNVRVDETGPHRVRAQAYFEATVILGEGTRRIIGRYDDDLALADGRWLFIHKRNLVEWTVELPAATRT